MRSLLAEILSEIEGVTTETRQSIAEREAVSGVGTVTPNPYVSQVLGGLRVSPTLRQQWENDKVLPTPEQLREIATFISGRQPVEGKESEMMILQSNLNGILRCQVRDVTPLYDRCGGYPTLRHWMVKTVHNDLRAAMKGLAPRRQEEVYRLAAEIAKSMSRVGGDDWDL